MKAIRFKVAIFTIMIVALAATNSHSMDMENYDIAVLGALNKITGKTSTIETNIGEYSDFGKLNIQVLACQKSSPLDTPESAAFLKIKENDVKIFSGWMYASSPGISAMESGIYDIWVNDCKKKLENSENNM